MSGHTPADHADQSEDLTADIGATEIRTARPSDLTSRDIEAAIQVRLERRGYDWAGAQRRRRGAS